MLTRIDISNYRGFKSYHMDGLAQVNLLVGKNNSGKTALAEAIHLITTGGDPVVLSDAAQRRGELTAFDDSGRLSSDLTHFFHGHELSANSSFSLEADNGFPKLTVRLVPLSNDPALFSEAEEEFESRPVFGVLIEGAVGFGSGSKDLGLTERGGLIFNPKARLRLSPPILGAALPPAIFVSTDTLAPRRLQQLWRQAVLDSIQQEVVSAMQIIESSIQQILYLPPDGGTRNIGSPRDWYVQSSEFQRPVPLGSFGDGVRRLMTLALALVRVRGGTLLVDEIDTGLHYSVMADMWDLVIKTAAEAGTQVFATTHSWDCIEGLSLSCQRNPKFIGKVAIHTVDRALPHSVAFAGDSIRRMVKHQIDPR